ncbi:hypothetical protein FCV25MIE_01218, partial [Fagus crenata]
KGTLRREDQQYGAWLRAGVDRPIRRVEVKVAGRSNIPRWSKEAVRKPVETSYTTSSSGGGAAPEVGETIMDFTRLKETLPQFSEVPNHTSDIAKQTVCEINVETKSPGNSVDTGVSSEPIAVRESRGEIQSNQYDPIMETGQLGGKENIMGGEDLKGMHEVIVQGESRGAWKRISRDLLIGASPGSHPLLSGIKRGGVWADFDFDEGSGQKKSRGEDISKRLDRAVANVQWMDLFNLCTVTHVVCSHSDHVPLNLHLNFNSMQRQRKQRPRKFEEKWALHPDCEVVISEVWNAESPSGSPMRKQARLQDFLVRMKQG